jgi:hypothetical protein
MRRPGRGSGLLLALSGWLGAAAASCGPTAPGWQFGAVHNTSTWREFDTAHQRLLQESGHLNGAEVAANYPCAGWTLQAHWAALDGVRAYQGQTSGGRAVVSSAKVRQAQADAQVLLGITDAWQVGAGLSRQVLWRDIASADGAIGYPERFDWTLLRMGAQWQTPGGPGLVSVAGWVGRPVASAMRVNLPGKDPATLALGGIRQAELTLGWRAPLAPGWQFEANLALRRTHIQQGAPSVLMRHGLAAGSAYQPHTSSTDRPLVLRLSYRF